MKVPWQGYRREWLVLVLVALSALVIVNRMNTQDVSRLSLTNAIVHRDTLDIDRTARYTIDKSRYGGHWYTDKAPGISLLAIAPVATLDAVGSVTHHRRTLSLWRRETHLWLIRLAVAGIFYLAAVFAVGRVAEGLARGTGAVTAVAFGLGSLAGPLALTTFGHVTASALSFAAFLLAWLARSRRRPWLYALAGLLAGCAVVVSYLDAIAAAAIGVYVLVTARRRIVAYLAGALPPAALLAWYDAAAFGAPWHVSYRYIVNQYAKAQQHGLFGISAPRLHSAWLVFGSRGLVFISPIVFVAALGLVLLWRRGARAEAGLCGAVFVLYVLANVGYFETYGGNSPGPRFLAGSLPYVFVGLAEAWRRWPLPTALVAVYSIALTTFDSITWSISNTLRLEVPPHTIWSLVGLPKEGGLLLLLAATAAATLVAGRRLAVSVPLRLRAADRPGKTGAEGLEPPAYGFGDHIKGLLRAADRHR